MLEFSYVVLLTQSLYGAVLVLINSYLIPLPIFRANYGRPM